MVDSYDLGRDARATESGSSTVSETGAGRIYSRVSQQGHSDLVH
jgi:hypothetical protein